MRTKKFWINRYKDFMEKVIEAEIRGCEGRSECYQEEIHGNMERYNEKLKNNSDDIEKYVVFLYVNHQINLLDPIGFCYPGIPYEYSSYAWGIVDFYFNNNKNISLQDAKKQVKNIYDCIGVGPSNPNKSLAKQIVKTLEDLNRRYDFKKDRLGERFNANDYWHKQYHIFQNCVLGRERMECEYEKIILKEQLLDLYSNMESNLEEEPQEYILFLYVNHYLNWLDPAKEHAPDLPYEHEELAWKIVKLHDSSSAEEFQEVLKEQIGELFKYLGYDLEQRRYRVNFVINKIQESIKEIFK